MASLAAPGRLELVRAFVNTVDLEKAEDPLAAGDGLTDWCKTSGLCGQAAEPELADLRRFREALREVLQANAAGANDAECWRALEPFVGRAGYTMCLSPAGTPVLHPAGSGTDAAISALLAIVYDAIAAGTWPRLKACRKHSCRWAFYDRSKNGSGAWCSMRVCGNRAKAQRRRTREKSQEIRGKK